MVDSVRHVLCQWPVLRPQICRLRVVNLFISSLQFLKRPTCSSLISLAKINGAFIVVFLLPGHIFRSLASELSGCLRLACAFRTSLYTMCE